MNDHLGNPSGVDFWSFVCLFVCLFFSGCLKEVIQQPQESKEKGEPGQGRVKSNSTNFETAASVFSVSQKQKYVATIFERVSFIPVIRCGAVNSIVYSFENKKKRVYKFCDQNPPAKETKNV